MKYEVTIYYENGSFATIVETLTAAFLLVEWLLSVPNVTGTHIRKRGVS